MVKAWPPSSPRNRDDLSSVVYHGCYRKKWQPMQRVLPHHAIESIRQLSHVRRAPRRPHRLRRRRSTRSTALRRASPRSRPTCGGPHPSPPRCPSPRGRSRCYHVTKHCTVAVRRRRLLKQTLHHCLSHTEKIHIVSTSNPSLQSNLGNQ